MPYTYDPNGNELSAGSSRYAYDLAGRLTSATVGSVTQSYTWSGDGIRLGASSGAQAAKTIGFLVDRSFALPSVVIERDGSGKLLRRYGYGLDLVSQTTPTKGPYWYHHDGLGSVSDITSTSGTPLWWAEYGPYGLLRASGSTSQAPLNPFMFTGAYQDAPTGLYHLRARQYDPALGRFLSLDPVRPAISAPAAGAYVYVHDDPVLNTDPSGSYPMTAAFVFLFGGLGTLVGPEGTFGGAALGVAAGTALCGAETVAEINLAKGVIETRGDPTRLIEVPFSPPYLGPDINQQTGDPQPRWSCKSVKCKVVVITVLGIPFLAFAAANVEAVQARDKLGADRK